ncbi:MAG TPA: M12 family metallo-peptidase [Chloroflexota bacterium]|jgi:hypothetical protein
MRRVRARSWAALGLALAMLIVSGPSLPPAPAAAQAGLFSDAARPPADTSAEMDRTIVRVRYVDVNLGLMDGTPRPRGTPLGRGDFLTLNLFNYSSALFPDVTVTAVRDRVEPSPTGQGFVWVGHVQGEDPAFSPVTLAVVDGALAGNVRAGGQTYQIRGTPGGGQVIYQVNERDVPPHEHVPVSAAGLRAAEAARAQRLGAAAASAPAKAPAAVADTGSTIDVLVAYTNQARADAGSTAQMQAQISLGITETNTAYTNSQVPQGMRLVGTMEVMYTSAGLANLQTDLRCVAGTVSVGGGDQIDPNSTCLSNVRQQRNTLGADIVSLWVEGTLQPGQVGAVGIGYVMSNVVLVNGQPNPASFEGFAYSVVARAFATAPAYTFAHETGHNLGANHDHATDGNPPSAIYPFAFDFIPANQAFHTIMAYPDKCNFCPAIQYYSNPNLTVQGQVIGVAGNGATAADNHQTMINTINAAINFRQCLIVPCNTNGGGPTATPTAPPTATPVGGATATPTANCTPRPNVTVNAVKTGTNNLTVTVTAGGTQASGPRLRQLIFPAVTNATLDIAIAGLTGVGGNRTVNLPVETRTMTFVVHHAQQGSATTVPFTVVDGCGNWPTFVGGGASAF